jgi:hypothetical protein
LGYSRTGEIRNDYDNNTADHNGCGSGPGDYDNAIFAVYHIPGRKGTAGCDHLSGKSAALCSDRIAGGILSEGCAGKYALRTAGDDRNAVLFIVVLHKWKKSTLLSIGGGTVFYMVLVQTIFG